MTPVQTIPPGIIRLEFKTQDEARASANTMQAMLELISETKQVVLRRAVTISHDREFDRMKDLWSVTSRFYLTEGPPGIMKTVPAGDIVYI